MTMSSQYYHGNEVLSDVDVLTIRTLYSPGEVMHKPCTAGGGGGGTLVYSSGIMAALE